jgi:hypothetical protein
MLTHFHIGGCRATVTVRDTNDGWGRGVSRLGTVAEYTLRCSAGEFVSGVLFCDTDGRPVSLVCAPPARAIPFVTEEMNN